MKRLSLLLFSFLLIVSGSAQDPGKSFFTDLDSAKQQASEQELPILMVFAGSDWCRPCMQFKEQVLLDESFQAYAQKEWVILYLDFPARKKNFLSDAQKKHNEALAERFNPQGAFPHIVLINLQEEVLARPTYHQQTAAGFIQELLEAVGSRQ